ncbi:MAG TPA: hypothetical protein VER33_06695 [Polyangiaceae bacterium]|nr:hypothetical protein [Polyangiaceae bacterium]
MVLGRSLGVYLAVVCIATLVSAARLRDMALDDVPFSLWLPFARPLAATVFEVTLLIAVPACALGSWCAGAPLRTALGVFALFSVLSVGAVLTFDPGKEVAPGLLAQELLDAARTTCPLTPSRRVHVPLVGVEWTCATAAAALVSGPSPLGGGSRFEATAIKVSPDLRELSLSDLSLRLPARGARPPLRLAVRHASIRGLAPWGRSRSVPLLSRLSSNAFALILTMTTGILLLRPLRWGFVFGVTAGLAAGLTLVGVQYWLDRIHAQGSSYWLAAATGPMVLCVASWGLALARRWRPGRSAENGAAGPG